MSGHGTSRLLRTLLTCLMALALAGCLAEARTEAELRGDPEFEGSAGGGGESGPQCSDGDLQAVGGSPESAMASCFLPPANCKSNGNNCIAKCLLGGNVPEACAVCMAERSPCVVDKCKDHCYSGGLVPIKALEIACPKCIVEECSQPLTECMTAP